MRAAGRSLPRCIGQPGDLRPGSGGEGSAPDLTQFDLADTRVRRLTDTGVHRDPHAGSDGADSNGSDTHIIDHAHSQRVLSLRMSDEAVSKPPGSEAFWHRFGQLAVILGPTTVLTAFLYYIGHVSAKAYYGHFGIIPSTLDVSATSVLLRSVDDLFDPLAVVILGSFAVFALHHLLVSAVNHARPAVGRALAIGIAAAALVLAGVGIAGLTGTLLSMITPYSLGLSGVALEYACWLTARTTVADSTLGRLVRTGVNLRRGLVAALVVLATFWAVTALANGRGTARAEAVEISLRTRSQAVVYSRTDLRLTGPGVRLTRLPGADNDFRYRYNGLRPLLFSGGRWLLLPVGWTSNNGSTVIILAEDPGLVRVDVAP